VPWTATRRRVSCPPTCECGRRTCKKGPAGDARVSVRAELLPDGAIDGQPDDFPVDDDAGSEPEEAAAESEGRVRARKIGRPPLPRLLQHIPWTCVGPDGTDRWAGDHSIVKRCPRAADKVRVRSACVLSSRRRAAGALML
jgi:hypothetical protein